MSHASIEPSTAPQRAPRGAGFDILARAPSQGGTCFVREAGR